MSTKARVLILGLLISCGLAPADTIRINATLHTDVVVREGAQRYYVQLPKTGETITASKDTVSTHEVIFDDDPQRAILLEQWKVARAALHPEREPSPTASLQTRKEEELRGLLSQPPPPETPTFSNRRAQPTTSTHENGISIQLSNIPLGEALRAILRSQNLDYEVNDNYLYISTPNRLRHEAVGPLQTRTYQLRNLGAETLPKITLRQPGVITQRAAQFGAGGGGQGGFGGGQGGFGGGQGGFGGGQGGFGGGQGGFGGGQGGFGGGQGGFGGGQGGFGGGQGGGGIAVGQLSLPYMITRFPDALVGETPVETSIVGIDRSMIPLGANGRGRP